MLAAAAVGPGEVVDEAGGAAQRVLGVEFGGDDVGGEFGLGGVLRDVVGKRGDGAFVAQGALLGVVGGGGGRMPMSSAQMARESGSGMLGTT